MARLEDSVGELKQDLLEIRRAVEQIRSAVTELQSEAKLIEHIETLVTAMHQHVFEGEVSDKSWLQLAESSFAFWDNEEDAIYDDM